MSVTEKSQLALTNNQQESQAQGSELSDVPNVEEMVDTESDGAL